MTGGEVAQKRILVIKLSAFGDFLLALGAMAAIRKAHPDAHITLLTTKLFKDMAERSRYFDEIWLDTKPKWNNIGAWAQQFKRFNAAGFSRVYDLQMTDRTRLYHALFIKKPEWSGVIKGSPLFYSNSDWRNMHAFTRHQEVLKVAGITIEKPDTSWMDSDISLFNLKKPYVLFIPGSAPQWPQKRWPELKYAALGLKLVREGYGIVVIGTNAEQESISRLTKACPEARDLCGQTSFYDIAALARGAAVTVGNDTGPTHLASLAGCPTVVLFSGFSKPELSAPVGNVQCIQCDDLSDLGVDQVYKAAQSMLT